MNNLVFQYYVPYQGNDKDMGGEAMPGWAKAGWQCAVKYANAVGAQHKLVTERYNESLDPRLDSLQIFNKEYDTFDYILSMDLDMLFMTTENVFGLMEGKDVAMVHELGVHTGRPAGWMRKVMDAPLTERGTIAYGKSIFGDDWMFPKSELYPKERFRYLNGGLQIWSKEGRKKAREHFTDVKHYVDTINRTEQQYINLQLSQPVFDVQELPTEWNRMPYQWPGGVLDGKINHFLNRHKFHMESIYAKHCIQLFQ